MENWGVCNHIKSVKKASSQRFHSFWPFLDLSFVPASYGRPSCPPKKGKQTCLACSVLKYKTDFLEIVSEMMKCWQLKHLALEASKQVSLVSVLTIFSWNFQHHFPHICFFLIISTSFSCFLKLCFPSYFPQTCFPYYIPHTLFFISFSSNFVAILCIYPLEKSKHTGHRRLTVRITTTQWTLVPRCKSWVSQRRIVVDWQPSSACPTAAADM